MIAKSNIRPANLARHAHARSSETCGSRSTHQYEIVTIAGPEFRRRGSSCAAALTTRGAWALLVKLGSGKVSALLSRGSGLGARRCVPAAETERRLAVQSADFGRNSRQRGRCAVTGRSRLLDQTPRFDPKPAVRYAEPPEEFCDDR